MGYTTDFDGHLDITPALTTEQSEYINRLSSTRRMKRDIKKLWDLYKGKHGNPFAKEQTPIAVYGKEGEFFAREDNNFGQTEDKSIIDYNTPPGQLGYSKADNFNKRWATNGQRKENLICQPGLWCQWEIQAEGEKLCWNGGEKFYDYVQWLRYLIDRFFEPWGVKLNGVIMWQGEEPDDKGKIVVLDNAVKILKAVITYEEQ